MKKNILAVLFFFLPCMLHAANCVYSPTLQPQEIDYRAVPSTKRNLFVYGYCKKFKPSNDILRLITFLIYDSPLRYRNTTLPNDLSGKDLSGLDFTGCHFTGINLTNANLANVILTNTTCDYQKAFQHNIKRRKIEGGILYQEDLFKDLQRITQVYPKLNSHAHKAKLLQIACGFAFLPFYENSELNIKVAYWSAELLQLKQALGKPYDNELLCSLAPTITYRVNTYCWTTNYPQNQISIPARAPHANFDAFLQDFKNGFTKYQCKLLRYTSYNHYKKHIIAIIKGMKEIYVRFQQKEVQQESCNIAHALSKSYQIQLTALNYHYLFYQDRIVSLKKCMVKIANE